MKKSKIVNVAVIFGGCSSEYGVSLQSASAVIRNLDKTKYKPVLIGITEYGDWYYYSGSVSKIQDNTWYSQQDCIPAVLSPNRSKRELLVLESTGVKKILIDVALPVLHGKNGEDGSVQGALSIADIPLAGCGILASALCMDKDRAHKMAGLAGVRVPNTLVLHTNENMKEAVEFAKKVNYPVFVKPVKAGSSYGITKVQTEWELEVAIRKAFGYDDEVILEENIEGFEVGCAILGNKELLTGEIDEIKLSQGFFDFTEKYTLKTSEIHVPAHITKEKSNEIKDAAKRIYKALGCSGFARVDMFLTPEDEIVFNEVNTIPGFTEHSRYPNMMKAAGFNVQEVLNKILQQALE